MHEEGMQILKMLEAGKISADEAARLLDAVRDRLGEGETRHGKSLRVRVTHPKTGKQAVNLSIPIGLAKIAAKLVPKKAKDKLQDEGVDVDAVLSQVLSDNVGKIVDVESEDGNVEISIE